MRKLIVSLALTLTPLVASADAVSDWNAIMQSTVATQNPFAQGRFAAITQLAVFEAVNAISGDYAPYLGTISAEPGASPDAAAVAAAHRVLVNYFPAAAPTLDAARAASLDDIPDGAAKEAGITVGEAAAVAMIASRANDGSAPPAFHTPAPPTPGEWQRTAGCPPAGGILRHWGNVVTFGLEDGSQFRADPPPSLTSAKYSNDYREVSMVGGVNSTERPADRAEVARFYNVVLAVATWNPAVRQVADAQGASLSEKARAFALLNMAISDALVTVMETKYFYTFWRPETAIPSFAPFIPTPCFPGYPSAHASSAYAARAIAERLFGDSGHSITLSNGGITLRYTSFEEITEDIDDARVYGGIHFRFDQKAGAKQGRQIGQYLFRNWLR